MCVVPVKVIADNEALKMLNVEQGLFVTLRNKYELRLITKGSGEGADEQQIITYEYLANIADEELKIKIMNSLDLTIGILYHSDNGLVQLYVDGQLIFVSRSYLNGLQENKTKIQLKGELHGAMQIATKKVVV